MIFFAEITKKLDCNLVFTSSLWHILRIIHTVAAICSSNVEVSERSAVRSFKEDFILIISVIYRHTDFILRLNSKEGEFSCRGMLESISKGFSVLGY